MIGEIYGKWTVIKESSDKPQKNSRAKFYECKCECGNVSIIRSDQLKSGRSKGCKDCYKIKFKKMVTKHSLHNSSTYGIWRGIHKRCKLLSHPSYRWYGAKGVKVCERWSKFESFLEDMGERPEGLQIDRIDTHGDYTKENCRWVTPKENQNNRKDNLSRRKITK